jgi:hypothetical protein
MRIEFESPIDQLFNGVSVFMPDIYLGLERLEVGKPYRVALKYSKIDFPRKRSKGSHIVVYALLYRIPRRNIIHVKLGTHTLYHNTAGLMWAQAPLYARVIGVFRLNRELKDREVEILEKKCTKHLSKSHIRQLQKLNIGNIKYYTSIPKTKQIINMWMSISGLKSEIDTLVDVVDETTSKCFDQLSRIKWIDPLYGNDMWFIPPLVEVNIAWQSIKPDIPIGENKESWVLEGFFTITPVGLCIFEEINEGARRIYVDRCRRFVYNFEFLVKE